MLTDPISAFLTSLRNIGRSRKNSFSFPSSKTVKAIAQILADRQFIDRFEEIVDGHKKELTIHLKPGRDPLELKRMSKPGQRIYVGYKDLKRVRNGLGIAILTTSKGLLTDAEVRKLKTGGEYICEVY